MEKPSKFRQSILHKAFCTLQVHVKSIPLLLNPLLIKIYIKQSTRFLIWNSILLILQNGASTTWDFSSPIYPILPSGLLSALSTAKIKIKIKLCEREEATRSSQLVGESNNYQEKKGAMVWRRKAKIQWEKKCPSSPRGKKKSSLRDKLMHNSTN